MGYSLFWLAVKGKAAEAVHAELKLHPTGEREEVPESDVTGLELPDGWYVVLDNRSVDFAEPAVLAQLSQGADVVTCFVEEHVMASEASRWVDGKQVWKIGHQSDRGIMNLDAEGNLPAFFQEIRTEAATQQANNKGSDVDYVFDVPVEIAKRLCGYRYDEGQGPEGGEGQFEVLERGNGSSMTAGEPPRKKGFWSRLFG